MRKIITYSTLGDNMKEIWSSAATLGELQRDMTKEGIRYEGMKLMTNPGQVTLESLQAELPQGEFQLFIMPQKVKSGSDEQLIDEDDGIEWNEVDWKDSDPEEYTFLTAKDLAIARSKRAFALLEKSISYLTNDSKATKVAPSGDPMLENLRAQARNLQDNMMFD